MLDKKANMVAVLLIGVAIVSGLVFIQQSGHTDSTDTFILSGFETTVRNAELWIDQALLSSVTEVADSGYAESNVWYCNAPIPPNRSGVEDLLNRTINASVTTINTSFGDSTTSLNISGFNVNTSGSTFNLALENTTLNINTDDLNATKKLSSETASQNRFWAIYTNLKNWTTNCRAGNVTEQLDQITRGTCSFKHCNCDQPYFTETAVRDIKQQYGVSERDVLDALKNTVDTLNDVMSGSASCTQSQNLSGVSCALQLEEICVGNQANTKVVRACQPTAAAAGYVPIGSQSELRKNEPLDYCPNRQQQGSSTLKDPESGKNDPYSDTGQPAGEVVALDKQVYAEYIITCEDAGSDVSALRTNTEVVVSAEQACEYPSLSDQALTCSEQQEEDDSSGGWK